MHKEKKTDKIEKSPKKVASIVERQKLDREHTEIIRKSKEEIFEKYRQDLPKVLEKRMEEISTQIASQIASTDSEKREAISPAVVYQWIKSPIFAPARSKYSAEDIQIILDNYTTMIAEINKNWTYIPTRENFCAFCGISIQQYGLWLRDTDHIERLHAMSQVELYIIDMQQSMAQTGETKEVTTIFRMKAEHGMIEAKAPQEITVKHDVSTSQIQEQIEAIKRGKSLEPVELKENNDGIFKQGGNK